MCYIEGTYCCKSDWLRVDNWSGIGQSDGMKIIQRVVVTLVVLLLGTTILLWTPDTSRVEMVADYAGPTSRFLELSNGDSIHYRDQGDKNATTLILIHGTSASLHTWEPLVDHLKKDFRLVSLDLPGHGLTGATHDRDYSPQAMTRALWRLMDHLQLSSAVLVGNSLGGRIAWNAALETPSRVDALVLLAPSGAPRITESRSNIGFKLLSSRVGQAVMKKVTPRFIIQKSLEQTVYDPSVANDEMVDRYWKLLRMEGNRQAMIDLARTPRDREKWRDLSKLTMPALIIWGEEDGLLPVAMATTFKEGLQNATLNVLPKVGHIPMEEAVDTVGGQIAAFCKLSYC